MTRTGPRAASPRRPAVRSAVRPAVRPAGLAAGLLALLLALGATAVPVLRGHLPAQAGRVVSAVHTHVLGSPGQPTERARVMLAAIHPDGAAAGGSDAAALPAPAGGLVIALTALGLAVLVVLRHDGRLVLTVRGRSPPRATPARRPS